MTFSTGISLIEARCSGSDELDGLVGESRICFLRTTAATGGGGGDKTSSGTGVDSLESRDCVDMDEEVSELKSEQNIKYVCDHI